MRRKEQGCRNQLVVEENLEQKGDRSARGGGGGLSRVVRLEANLV